MMRRGRGMVPTEASMRALPSLLHVLVTFAALTSTCRSRRRGGHKQRGHRQQGPERGASDLGLGRHHCRGCAYEGRDAHRRQRAASGDNTLLTLGEHASVVIDRYVYDPDRNVGETALQATEGAFRFATRRIKEMKDHKIVVSTPSPISVSAAPNSGVGRSRNMGCCCSKEKSSCPTRLEVSC